MSGCFLKNAIVLSTSHVARFAPVNLGLDIPIRAFLFVLRFFSGLGGSALS